MYSSCAAAAAAPDRPSAPSSSFPLLCGANVTLPVRGVVVDRAELSRWNAAGYSVTWAMPTGTAMADGTSCPPSEWPLRPSLASSVSVLCITTEAEKETIK